MQGACSLPTSPLVWKPSGLHAWYTRRPRRFPCDPEVPLYPNVNKQIRKMRALSVTRGLQHHRKLRGPKQHMLRPISTQPVSTTVRTTPHAAAVEPQRVTDSIHANLTAGFDSVEDGIAAIARGEFVLVMDDQDRENEGDLIIAAEMATQQKIAYMVEYTSGVLCVALPEAECERLQLPLMVPTAENEESMYTAFTVTVDLREGITTGISAADRSATIRALADPDTQASDLRKPGHIFPLIAREGGVITRPGHTEAAVDMARLAGCRPAGVLCEVVDKRTGEMARTPELLAMARAHNLKCITIEDLIEYRTKHDAGS